MSRTGFLLIAVAGLGLLAGSALARRGEPRPPSSPQGPSREEAAAAAVSAPEAATVQGLLNPRTVANPPPARHDPTTARTGRHGDEQFWDELSRILEDRPFVDPATYQERVAASTAEYLGLEQSRAADFKATTAVVRTELQRAWASRDDALLRLPAWLSAGVRSEREEKIQEQYEDAKRQALGRVEALLGDAPRHRRFRSKLEEWIDAVR